MLHFEPIWIEDGEGEGFVTCECGYKIENPVMVRDGTIFECPKCGKKWKAKWVGFVFEVIP